jgi:hypothetical protein
VGAPLLVHQQVHREMGMQIDKHNRPFVHLQ